MSSAVDEGLGRRARRSTRYSGDFHLSFGDASTDDEEREITEEKKKRASAGKATRRNKECPGCGMMVALSIRECSHCDYQFTSKSMLVNQQSALQESLSIRDRFPFEPERDDDGSLMIHSILGRRTKKSGKRWQKSSGPVALADMTAMESKYEYEFLVKYKSMSYLHTQWLSTGEIEAMSQKNKAVLNRYLTRLDRGDSTMTDDADIDPSYTEVEKILDFREMEVEEVVDDLHATHNQMALKEVEKLRVAAEKGEDIGDTAGASSGDQRAQTDYSSQDAMVGKSASQIFQPVERCRQVLEKVWEDPYSSGFQDPVDTNDYPDYLDVVEEPMCLRDVKTKLENGDYSKFMAHRQFAQDMRKIWRNCKLYNLYKSQIWYCANYLSMLFERLYQSWVISFSDGTLPLSNPLARPWESSCRVCLSDDYDDKLILCDHCDASFHIFCLKPALAKVPEDAWMCQRCIQWLARSGVQILSATAEDDARLLIEGATTKKVVRVLKKKYLVKWRGLSYRDCTWETAEAINDDEKIAEYHRLNDSPPDEPPLTQAEIGVELAKDRKSQLYPAGYNGGPPNPVADLDAQIYAQIRAAHFLRWNKTVPQALLKECGPASFAYTETVRAPLALPRRVAPVIRQLEALQDGGGGSGAAGREGMPPPTGDDWDDRSVDDSVNVKHLADCLVADALRLPRMAEETDKVAWAVYRGDPYRLVVGDLLAEMVYAVARDHDKVPVSPYPSRPPLPPRYQIPSEIEICVPKGVQSLCMKVGNFHDNVVVLGFRPSDGRGSKGAVERSGRVRPGDLLVAINGLYVHDLKFAKILKLLGTNRPFLYLRFLRLPACLESRQADVVEKYMSSKEASPRPSSRPGPRRSLFFGVYPHPSEAHQWVAAYYRRQDCIEVGVFADEVEAAQAYDRAVRKEENNEGWSLNFDEDGEATASAKILHRVVSAERKAVAGALRQKEEKGGGGGGEAEAKTEDEEKDEEKEEKDKDASPSDTHDSAVPMDVADSPAPSPPSGEGATCAMDTTSAEDNEPEGQASDLQSLGDFHSEDSRDSESERADSDLSGDDQDRPPTSDEDDDDEDDDDDADDDDDDVDDDDDGDASIVRNGKASRDREESAKKPDGRTPPAAKGRERTPYEAEGPIGRLLRAVNECQYPPIRSDWQRYILELGLANAAAKSTGTPGKSRKVDQVDILDNEVIRTWDSMLTAARSLNIPTIDIHAVLNNKKESAGGFKWRYVDAAVDNKENAGEAEDDGLDEKKDDSWQLKIPTSSKEYKSGGKLRDYQVEGLSWLLRCWYLKRSSILADEMGLGKTVQVVTFLDHLFEVENMKGPFLVCVPLSTIGHWKREFDSWSHMQSCVYHDVGGGRDMRDVIREFEWYYKGRSRRLLKFHVLITTYDDLVRDYEELAEIPWRVVIVDEAHRLRNINSRLLECMRTVVAKGVVAYGYQHRILMTGTPLQNNTVELWSLLNFIEPAKFPDLDKFQDRFGSIKTQEQVDLLQRRIGPHLLRRVKEDVARDIPPKEETIIDVELTTMQKQYYRAIYEHNHSFLMQNLRGNMPKLMNIQMELRKCCNHPFLIHGIEQKEMENLESSIEESAERVTTAASRSKLLFDQNEFERRRMEETLIPSSGKMVLLDKLLPKLRKEGHKVLIFSQMVKMIDLIEEFCDFRKYPCERLDGRVAGNDRQKSIDKFNKDSASFIFLLSTRAGGVGINLTAADTVIIFDSDWNPQNDIQAMARCHRIGQSKNVKIYRLITRRSFEAEMFDRASKKLGLEQAVLGTRNFNDIDWDDAAGKSGPKLDAKEMEQLLREGAYAVLLEDDTQNMREFYEQDIEQILEQRAHVLVSEGGQTTESWLNKRKKTSKTNKRLFTGDSAKEHAEIDVDDPDFWKKVLPDLVTPDTMLDRLTDDSLVNDEDDHDAVDKFMRDLAQMMEGMMDLSRRSQLPERERAVCLKLLLRITLKDDIFEEEERAQAQEWLSALEGTRSRRNRQDIYKTEDHRRGSAGRGRAGRGGKDTGGGGGGAAAAGGRGRGGGKSRSSLGGKAGGGGGAVEEDAEEDSAVFVTPKKRRGKYADTEEADDMELDADAFDEDDDEEGEEDYDDRRRRSRSGGAGRGAGRGKGRARPAAKPVKGKAVSTPKEEPSASKKRRRRSSPASSSNAEDDDGPGSSGRGRRGDLEDDEVFRSLDDEDFTPAKKKRGKRDSKAKAAVAVSPAYSDDDAAAPELPPVSISGRTRRSSSRAVRSVRFARKDSEAEDEDASYTNPTEYL